MMLFHTPAHPLSLAVEGEGEGEGVPAIGASMRTESNVNIPFSQPLSSSFVLQVDEGR